MYDCLGISDPFPAVLPVAKFFLAENFLQKRWTTLAVYYSCIPAIPKTPGDIGNFSNTIVSSALCSVRGHLFKSLLTWRSRSFV